MQLKRNGLSVVLALALPVFITACEGDDGATGAAGPAGPAGSAGTNGSNGASSLIVQTQLAVGNANCPNGGVQIDSGLDLDGNGTLDAGEITSTARTCNAASARVFKRIASFPVCSQIEANCNDDTETAAEIVAASADATKLIYTDSPAEALGFVDIGDPANPVAGGTLPLGGEPTSVAVSGNYALVGINTSADFINTSGELLVVDVATEMPVVTIALAGQPDSVAVSPDGNYAAVIIENERDEDLGDGEPPQLPAGTLEILDISGDPMTWATTAVDLTGFGGLFDTDPEPEYVDINEDNVAVVTLQENNHIFLVDVTDGSIVNDFSAGTVDLVNIDATEGEGDADKNRIDQTEQLADIPREPDGVSWINTELFATADEGDLDGGSRGFTVFNTNGDVVYSSGNTLEHETASLGHYPDERSGNKGNEPENAEFGNYDGDRFLFVASERSSLLFVYDVSDPVNPVLKQSLPAAAGPEGVLAIPSRNLLVAASEEDDRGDKLRSVVNIYDYAVGNATYPTIRSVDRGNGTPIPWGAMSGLAADPADAYRLYAVEDSFYGSNRIFGIDTSVAPASLDTEITITDTNDVFAGIATVALADATVDDDDATRIDVFDEADLALLINADKTVNIDPEGVALASAGGFWVASEGSGTVGDARRPVNSLNFLFKLDATGVIEEVITLPQAQNDAQLRFGFEGVTEYDGSVYVAFQRVWPGDTNVRIGVYDITAATWSFLFYPLDAVESQNGGWVGLSDITSLGNGRFLVIERDNQGGPDAAIKRLYTFDVTGLAADSVVTKTLLDDLIDDLGSTGGLTAEKVEGSAVDAMGQVWIINDNDGVDDNSGETNLINLGNIL